MHRFSRYAFATGFAVVGLAYVMPTVPAMAQPVEPGAEGELANLLPPEVGRRVCYARRYDAAHLNAHPQQKVAEIKFRLAYYRHDPDDYAPQGQRNYYFAVLARLRGQDETLTSIGECVPFEGQISCGVECDGGGFALTRRPPDKVLISLGDEGRLRMTRGCDESDSVDLESGADDKEFLLTRTDDKSCPAYEDW
jgi:hypothetical protein